MARKSANPNKAAVIRVIVCMAVWVAYLLFSLACVSYSPDDTAHQFLNGSFDYHNWCGAFGAHLAETTLAGAGPGVFVAIVLLGAALVLWTRGQPISQLPLRVIGGALLVAVVSTLFNMLRLRLRCRRQSRRRPRHHPPPLLPLRRLAHRLRLPRRRRSPRRR